jgi:hypothetical protein
LTLVDFSESKNLTTINSYAFQNCTSLDTLELPDSVKTIGAYAFAGCTGFRLLNLNDGLETIGSRAFQGCNGLVSLVLNDGLLTLSEYAFANCENLTTVSIPKSVTDCSTTGFQNCPKIVLYCYSGTAAHYAAEFAGYKYVLLDDHTHTFEDYIETEVTCTRGGSRIRTCSQCGYHYTEVMEPLGHEYEETVVEPTCTEQGYTQYTCVRGDDAHEGQYVDALGHDYEETVVAPTCTEQGYTLHTCVREDDSYQDQYVDAVGHTYGDWIVDQEATTSEVGSRHRVCTIDDAVETEEIPMLSDPVIHYYKVFDLDVDSWVDAQKYCESLGGHLATLTSREENDFVYQLMLDSGYTSAYFGLTNREEEGTWTWVNGELGSYTNWHPGEPSEVNRFDEDYAMFSDQYSDGTWDDGDFSKSEETETIPFICEWETGDSFNLATGNSGSVHFKVVNSQTLEPIPRAHITIDIYEETTDDNGEATLVVPTGEYTVIVVAPDCNPRSFHLTVEPGENEVPRIGMSNQSIYDATVTSHRMTYDEIVDAGIDVDASSNQHVYKYELTLTFVPEIDWLSLTYYMDEEGIILGGSSSGGGGGSSNAGGGGSGSSSGGGGSWSDTEYYWVNDGGGKGHFFIPPNTSTGSTEGNEESISIYPVSEYFYLIIRGEIKWLKEMFDVEMLVVNNSMTDTLTGLAATLELPETGLSLAEMTGTQQTLTQSIPDIAEGGSESVHWYVRGDTTGSYNVSARLQGTIMPFGEKIDDTFLCQNSLQVWAGSALHLNFEFPSSTYYDDDYPITVTLENVSDITLYNLSHKIQIEQGMIYYYDDGTTKQQIKTSQWYTSGVIQEFRPGDKLVMEMTVNIFFKSEIAEQKIEEMLSKLDGTEQLFKAYKAVQTGIKAAEALQKSVSGAVKALDGFDFSKSSAKMKLYKELHTKILKLYTSYSTSGNKTFDSVLKTANAGVNVALDAISNDPEDWLKKTTYEDMAKLVQNVDSLTKNLNSNSGDTRKFDVYDSLRTLISAIPIRFVLSDVFMTEDEDNTTSIPWSYSVTEGHVQYFGVTSLSKTLMSYVQYGMASMWDEAVPWYLQLIPGVDNPFNKDEAVKYLQTVEDEVSMLKAKSATGDVTFKVWIEHNSGEKSVALLSDNYAVDDFELSCDNDSAVVENGVLTFTGDGLISVKPTSLNGGTLHIEDSEGNSYIYELEVVSQHICTPGEQEIIVQPTSEYEGFAVRSCSVCGDLMEVEILSEDDLCAEHQFGDWELETEATHAAAGMQHRICAVCGAEEVSFTEKEPYKCEELPVSMEGQTATTGTVSLKNLSNETASMQFVLAAYDTNGKMIGVSTEQVEMSEQETMIQTVEWDEGQTVEKFVVFLLDPTMLSPLCEAQEILIT